MTMRTSGKGALAVLAVLVRLALPLFEHWCWEWLSIRIHPFGGTTMVCGGVKYVK